MHPNTITLISIIWNSKNLKFEVMLHKQIKQNSVYTLLLEIVDEKNIQFKNL